MPITEFDDDVNEQTSAQYSCTFVDATGAAIADGAVSAIVATLVDVSDGTTINSRSAQNVLNANGGTWASGTFTLTLGSADTVARGTATMQRRRLTLKVTYTGGVITHAVEFYVRALDAIT